MRITREVHNGACSCLVVDIFVFGQKKRVVCLMPFHVQGEKGSPWFGRCCIRRFLFRCCSWRYFAWCVKILTCPSFTVQFPLAASPSILLKQLNTTKRFRLVIFFWFFPNVAAKWLLVNVHCAQAVGIRFWPICTPPPRHSASKPLLPSFGMTDDFLSLVQWIGGQGGRSFMRQHVNEQTKKGFLFPINTTRTTNVTSSGPPCWTLWSGHVKGRRSKPRCHLQMCGVAVHIVWRGHTLQPKSAFFLRFFCIVSPPDDRFLE